MQETTKRWILNGCSFRPWKLYLQASQKAKQLFLNTFPKITAVGSIDKSITTMSSVRSCEMTLHPEYLGLGAVVIPHQLRSSFNTLCIEEEQEYHDSHFWEKQIRNLHK